MTRLRPGANMLKVSSELKESLATAGTVKRYRSKAVLFEVDEENRGVYLVLRGKVCLSVKDFHKLDRTFAAGSLLGVPATYTGHTYSLTAKPGRMPRFCMSSGSPFWISCSSNLTSAAKLPTCSAARLRSSRLPWRSAAARNSSSDSSEFLQHRLQKLPEALYRRNLHPLVWAVRIDNRRSERHHLHAGIFLSDHAAL